MPQNKSVPSQWTTASPSHIKINVDAAVGRTNSYLAAVARDSNCNFVGAGTWISTSTIPLVAESQALLHAFSGQLISRIGKM